jgi:hypothetical protein
MSHQAPTVTQSLSGKLRILDHKYLRTVEPWLPVAVWGLSLLRTRHNMHAITTQQHRPTTKRLLQDTKRVLQ